MGFIRKVTNWLKGSRYRLPQRSLDDLKQITRIVFVDDGTFEVIQILRNAGWIHTERIDDVDSLDAARIRDAHILFIDIGGVGKKLKFRDEGLGLISALRQKYTHKKLVVYSAERMGDRFHEGLSAADERLAKNADPFQFQAIVEDFSREAFSLDECVSRLQRLLTSEFDLYLSEADIRNNMRRLAANGDVSQSSVERVFKLSNAGSVASIISLFFSAA